MLQLPPPLSSVGSPGRGVDCVWFPAFSPPPVSSFRFLSSLFLLPFALGLSRADRAERLRLLVLLSLDAPSHTPTIYPSSRATPLPPPFFVFNFTLSFTCPYSSSYTSWSSLSSSLPPLLFLPSTSPLPLLFICPFLLPSPFASLPPFFSPFGRWSLHLQSSFRSPRRPSS